MSRFSSYQVPAQPVGVVRRDLNSTERFPFAW